MPLNSDLEQQFIARLAQAAIDGTLPAEFSEDDAREVMTGFVGPAAVAAQLTELFLQDLIHQTSTNPVEFGIRMKLLRKAEEIGTTTGADAQSESEPILELAGDDDTVTDNAGIPIIAVPASDRIVSRTDNQGAWDEAIGSLDATIAEYKKDHPRDNEVGSEKSALLGALVAGRKLFDDTRINVEVGVALLIEPLKLIVSRYEKELVGGLAATACAAIAKVFGIL